MPSSSFDEDEAPRAARGLLYNRLLATRGRAAGVGQLRCCRRGSAAAALSCSIASACENDLQSAPFSVLQSGAPRATRPQSRRPASPSTGAQSDAGAMTLCQSRPLVPLGTEERPHFRGAEQCSQSTSRPAVPLRGGHARIGHRRRNGRASLLVASAAQEDPQSLSASSPEAGSPMGSLADRFFASQAAAAGPVSARMLSVLLQTPTVPIGCALPPPAALLNCWALSSISSQHWDGPLLRHPGLGQPSK